MMSSKFRLSPLSSSSCSSSSSSLFSKRDFNVRRKANCINTIGGKNIEQEIVSIVKVKKEPVEDEIKEYAANAMSELLGWYGYDKVDSGCTRGLNLDHFAASASPKHRQSSRLSTNKLTSAISRQNANRSPTSRTSRSSPSISLVSCKENGLAPSSSPLSLRTAPASPRILENSDSTSDTPDSLTTCSWCGRPGGAWEPTGSMSFTGINNSSRFCSEACFAAGRRAAFKRARTCDWCRHVRHSVSYVDFQDGERQLQFCSDKCLNQYKMNIFCHETQTHLALHGLTASQTTPTPSSSQVGGLITPDLWLRDCRSPPPSPGDTEEDPLIVDDDPVDCPQDPPGTNVILRVSTRSPSIDEEATVEEAIKESLKDEENRRTEELRSSMLCETEPADDRSTKVNSPTENISKPSKVISAAETINKPSKVANCKDSREQNNVRESCIHLKDMRKLMSKDRQSVPFHTRPRKWLVDSLPSDATPLRDLQGGMNSYSNFPLHAASHNCPTPHATYSPPGSSYPTPNCHAPHNTYPAPNSNCSVPHPPSHSQAFSFFRPPPPVHLYAPPTSGLLPPVTVLLPYPIPIPLPIPIPIPIPLFGKFFDEKTKNCENEPAADSPEDLSKYRKGRAEGRSVERNSEVDEMTRGADTGDERGGTERSDVVGAGLDEEEAQSPVAASSGAGIQKTADGREEGRFLRRPLRKKRRISAGNSDELDGRIKRRSKVLPV